MLGFFIGAACLVGLFAVARSGPRPFGRGAWYGRRGGGRFWFRRALHRLDTTPGQEKVIRTALNELREEASSLRVEARGTRLELAAALRAPELDKAALDRVFEKHDELIERLRGSLLHAMDQVHGTLDDRQRRQLADMVESGHRGLAGC